MSINAEGSSPGCDVLITCIVSPSHSGLAKKEGSGRQNTVMLCIIVSLQLSLFRICLTKKVPHVSNKK